MGRLISILVLTLFYALSVSGQSSILEKINAIKDQNNVYFWCEYTHPVPDTAIVNASKWMLDEININRETPLSLEAIMPLVKNIKMDRGTLTRAFVYIRKSDVPDTGIIPASPVQESVMADEPISMEPKYQPQSQIQKPALSQFVPEVMVQNILELKDFYKVHGYLKEQKNQGQILLFGALKEVDDYNPLHLVLFDMQSKQVLSILSPVTRGDKRVNMATGMEDTLDNYPDDMLFVIWYMK